MTYVNAVCLTCLNVASVLLQFNKQIKKAEGHKPQKVELIISIDNVSVVEPKFKVIAMQNLIQFIKYAMVQETATVSD